MKSTRISCPLLVVILTLFASSLAAEEVIPDLASAAELEKKIRAWNGEGSVTVKPGFFSPGCKFRLSFQEAGELSYVAKLYSEVKKGQVLAQQDLDLAQIEVMVKRSEVELARVSANDSTSKRENEARLEFTQAELDSSLAINQRTKNIITETEIRRQKAGVTIQQCVLERSGYEGHQNQILLDKAKAEFLAAQSRLEHRKIIAPFNATVIWQYAYEREHVAPGEKVIELAYLDVLRVDGHISASSKLSRSLDGCLIQAVAEDGKTTLHGQIAAVSPVLSQANETAFYGYIRNVKLADGQWAIRPGDNRINLEVLPIR